MVGFLYVTVSGMVICYSQIRHRREMRQKMAGKPGMTEICQPCVDVGMIWMIYMIWMDMDQNTLELMNRWSSTWQNHGGAGRTPVISGSGLTVDIAFWYLLHYGLIIGHKGRQLKI